MTDTPAPTPAQTPAKTRQAPGDINKKYLAEITTVQFPLILHKT